MNALPGVKSAALAVVQILDGNEWDQTVTVEGYTTYQGEYVDLHMQFISPRFFDTMGIPLLLGRDFTIQDDKGTPKVAIANDTAAMPDLGGANAIGRHVGNGGNPG